ncbi:MAG: hypothetical protein COA49_01805 [Bacteroidetes bacterium]|nr:MAG: hypothetical protein COA49_01805 [Bacteroidota bacterium]
MNKALLILPAIFSLSLTLISGFSLAQTTPYFQQTVNHVINVQLNDVDDELDADIVTTYLNNSPDELDFIWMHVWPNAYSSSKTALAKQQFRGGDLFLFYAIAKDMGGIDGLDFKIDGSKANWEFHPQHPDIVKVYLNKPLASGESIEISTPFSVRIPSGKISRLGHIGESYQITQWYPKPAVYDRDGWHEMPYLDQGEFYSEYGTFDVFITLPDNYTVGATGDLLSGGSNDNDAEIYRLEKLNNETRLYFKRLDEGGAKENPEGEFPESSNKLKTLHYHQENVHDFAWFADKRFKVLKDSIKLPHSGREVTTWVMFTPNEEDLWRDASKYIGNATYYYSLWNGDYPYNQVTAIDGTISAGGGMEYPNVTVIGESRSAFSLDVVIAHEVGHNWFYGILGSNERTNAWMDEGLNSLNETRYLLQSYEDRGPDLGLISSRLSDKWMKRLDIEDFEYRWVDELAYILPARFGTDQALQCHSDAFSPANYGAIVYKKTAAIFAFLHHYLGTERFDLAMQKYFEDWKFKHPSPSDLQKSMENSCGEDLSWFFGGWINTTHKNDWKIVSSKAINGGTEVIVKNSGELTSPVEIVVFNNETKIGRKWVSPSEPGSKQIVFFDIDQATLVVLDPNRYDLDYDRKNNNSKTKGILKKVEPLKISLLTRLEDGTKTQLFYSPAMAWNAHNGLMLGATFHNTTIPLRDFEWMFTPLLSNKSSFGNSNLQLAGVSRITYHTGPFSFALKMKRFSSPERIDYTIEVDIPQSPNSRISFNAGVKLNKITNSNWSSKVKFEYAFLNGFADSDFYSSAPKRTSLSLKFDALKSRGNIIGLSQNMGVELRQFNFDVPTTNLPIWQNETYSYDFLQATTYYSLNKEIGNSGHNINLQLLGKANLSNSYSHQSNIATAGYGADFDPMADNFIFDRNSVDGLMSNQVSLEYGALPLRHYAKNWMTSARLGIDLSDNFELFGGVLFYDTNIDETASDAVAGLTYSLGPIKITMPLISSSMMSEINLGQSYAPQDYFLFTLDLRSINPWELVRRDL